MIALFVPLNATNKQFGHLPLYGYVREKDCNNNVIIMPIPNLSMCAHTTEYNAIGGLVFVSTVTCCECFCMMGK